MNNLGDLRVVELDISKAPDFDFRYIDADEAIEIADSGFIDIQYYEGKEFQIKILGYSEEDVDGWSSYDMLEDGTALEDCTVEQVETDLAEKVRIIKLQIKDN